MFDCLFRLEHEILSDTDSGKENNDGNRKQIKSNESYIESDFSSGILKLY